MHKDHETVMLFRSTQEWNGRIITNAHMPDAKFEGLKKYLESILHQVDNDIMKNYFIDWPQNKIEEWAVEFNDSFTVKFDIYYNTDPMVQQLDIKAFGNISHNWIEYEDAYQQAYTMMKLESNL